jgi:hypothetical protein
MEDRSPNGLNHRANNSESGTEHEQRQYQFGGDYVITSSTSAGAWISATYPTDLTEAR